MTPSSRALCPVNALSHCILSGKVVFPGILIRLISLELREHFHSKSGSHSRITERIQVHIIGMALPPIEPASPTIRVFQALP